MNPRYGMTEPPVPSSSNNWPRGWIHSVRCPQNSEVMLETWAPKSISVVISYPSTITGALLECPNKWVMGSGLRKGTGMTSSHPFFWATFSMVSFGSGLGRECWGLLLAVVAGVGRGLGHIPSVPPDWFKVFAGVAHSQAMWPQPCHLKHWRELGPSY